MLKDQSSNTYNLSTTIKETPVSRQEYITSLVITVSKTIPKDDFLLNATSYFYFLYTGGAFYYKTDGCRIRVGDWFFEDPDTKRSADELLKYQIGLVLEAIITNLLCHPQLGEQYTAIERTAGLWSLCSLCVVNDILALTLLSESAYRSYRLDNPTINDLLDFLGAAKGGTFTFKNKPTQLQLFSLILSLLEEGSISLEPVFSDDDPNNASSYCLKNSSGNSMKVPLPKQEPMTEEAREEQKQEKRQPLDKAHSDPTELLKNLCQNYGVDTNSFGIDITGDFGPAKLNWKALLRHYAKLSLSDKKKASYHKPSRRMMAGCVPRDVVLPTIKPELRIKRIVVGFDLSGSCFSEEIIVEALQEIEALHTQVSETIIVTFDVEVKDVFRIPAKDTIKSSVTSNKIVFRGGGGTCFQEVSELAASYIPTLVVFFTDCDGSFHDSPPGSSNISWLWCSTHSPAPWGTTIYIDAGD